MTTITVTEARAALSELLARVEAGDEVTLTRHGKAVAVLVRPDALRPHRAERAFADAARIHRLVTESATDAQPVGLDVAWAEELVTDIRADRDAR